MTVDFVLLLFFKSKTIIEIDKPLAGAVCLLFSFSMWTAAIVVFVAAFLALALTTLTLAGRECSWVTVVVGGSMVERSVWKR